MRANWKFLRLAAVPVLVWLGAGCGGITASKSVSPASFFLPGLMQADPAPPPPGLAPPAVAPPKELARS